MRRTTVMSGGPGRAGAALSVAVLVVVATVLAAALLPAAARRASVTSTRVSLAFVGDVLPHLSLVDSTLDPATGQYDFGRVFAPVAPYLAEADLTVANLETRLAGGARGYQGYPLFDSPDELAADLASSGVDAAGTANNHALDMGFEGIVRTLDVLDAAGLRHAGTARSAAESDATCMVDVRGVRVALLNYTGYSNVPVPAGRPWALDVLMEPAVTADAARARAAGADLMVAFLHWGNEYTRYPSAGQRELAPRLLDAGVDAIVGAGPHMVQPVSRVRAPSGREGFVAWSLGNFVSDQRLRYRDSGLVLYLDVVKDGRGASVSGVRYLPLYTQKARSGDVSRFRVIPVHPGPPVVGDLGLSVDDTRRMDQVWHETTAHLAGVPGVTAYQPPGLQ